MMRFFGLVVCLLILTPAIAFADETTPEQVGETTQGQYVPLTGIPYITQNLLGDGCRDGGSSDQCETSLGSVFQGVIIFLIGAGGVLAVGYFMWGAIQYMTQDIPSLKQNGREKMLAAVGGLASVLVAFTLLQIIAPGLEKSIETFNEYLKPVEAPKCLGTEEGCLEAKGEGGIVSFSGDSLTEGVEDIPPTSTGNGGETIVTKDTIEGIITSATGDEEDAKKVAAFKEKCKGDYDSAVLATFKVDSSSDSPAVRGGWTSKVAHVCFGPLDVSMGPPVQEELTTYHPSDDFEYIKKSNAYKEFVKNCEKDWSSYYKENGNIDLALHELKPIRGKVKSLGGKKPATPDGPYVCRKDFNGHETDCRYDPDGDGRYAYYLEAAWVCSFEGL